jgi:hypothetical protein
VLLCTSSPSQHSYIPFKWRGGGWVAMVSCVVLMSVVTIKVEPKTLEN